MGKKAKSIRLDPKSKIRLLGSWLRWFHQETESWADESVGMHIGYLVKAVICDEWVEWSEDNPVIGLILKKDPKRKAAIWTFIRLVNPVDSPAPRPSDTT